MPTLRAMIDETTIFASAPKSSKPSPAAQHVSEHLQDPFGATKDAFSDTQEKKMAYDQSREQLQRQLAMPQAVIDQAAQLHGLTVGNNQSMMPGTPAMGQGAPGAQDNPEMDEDGNPIPPGQNGMPTPQGPGAIIGKPMPGQGPQNPANMSQTVGKMNSNRPSLVGQQPGVAPGPQQSVVPPKLGQAQPGKPIAQNSPQPGANMYNKQAAPPKGNKKLPGAKGPGDPKVANKAKTAQSKSAREIKVHVTASGVLAGSQHRIESYTGLESLRAGGPGSGRRKELESLQRQAEDSAHQAATPQEKAMWQQKAEGHQKELNKLQAGPDSLSDKVPGDTQHEVAYNPKFDAKGKVVKEIKTCKTCGKKHMGACSDMKAGGPGSGRRPGFGKQADKVGMFKNYYDSRANKAKKEGKGNLSEMYKKLSNSRTKVAKGMESKGHALGAKKGWASRGKGHLAKTEKKALYETLG